MSYVRGRVQEILIYICTFDCTVYARDRTRSFVFAIVSVPYYSVVTFYSLLQESLEERVQELEQALLAERIAAQRDRATITKLQRQINKVYFLHDIYRTNASRQTRKVSGLDY